MRELLNLASHERILDRNPIAVMFPLLFCFAQDQPDKAMVNIKLPTQISHPIARLYVWTSSSPVRRKNFSGKWHGEKHACAKDLLAGSTERVLLTVPGGR